MLIGISGAAGSGKSTLAAVFCANAPILRTQAFADPLREMLQVVGMDTSEAAKMRVDPVLGVTPRYALQTLGTDWGRNLVHQDIWRRVFEQRYLKSPNVVCPDVRFDNEADLIRRLGGVVIHMHGRARPTPKLPFSWRRPSTWLRRKHASEKGVLAVHGDLYFDNSVGTSLEQMQEFVARVLIQLSTKETR